MKGALNMLIVWYRFFMVSLVICIPASVMAQESANLLSYQQVYKGRANVENFFGIFVIVKEFKEAGVTFARFNDFAKPRFRTNFPDRTITIGPRNHWTFSLPPHMVGDRFLPYS